MDGDLSIHFENFVSLFCSDMCAEGINLTVNCALYFTASGPDNWILNLEQQIPKRLHVICMTFSSCLFQQTGIAKFFSNCSAK